MQGFLASEGLRVSENRIGNALQAVHPDYNRMRLNGASQSLNPQPILEKNSISIKMKSLSCLGLPIFVLLMATLGKLFNLSACQ